MFSLALFLMGVVVSAVAIHYGIQGAHRFGVVDKPGGHKAHDTVTPFVGGLGILAAMLTAGYVVSHYFPAFGDRIFVLMAGALILFVTGFADDILHLNYKIRFGIQAGVGLMMVYWGGVQLADLGQLASDDLLLLGFLGVPLTLVATIGAINALNMIDGIDGLSGSLSIVSLLLIALAVYISGDLAYFSLIIIVAGGVAGFLLFNLRYLGWRRARCFMGDNGSMQLGFLFAWLLSDLSQANDSVRAITPITTLWLFAVPLIDTLCVMLRRMWMGRSPFHADRNHLHHLFLRAGFRVQDAVLVLALVQFCFGAVGLLGMYAGVDELAMLAAFVMVFAACFFIVLRPWRLVPLLRRIHRVLGMTSVHAVGVHVAGLSEPRLAPFAEMLNRCIGPHVDFRFRAYRTEGEGGPGCYGVIQLLGDDQDLTQLQISRIIAVLRREVGREPGVKIRQFVDRKESHDRRVGAHFRREERRGADRRASGKSALVYRLDSAAGEPSIVAQG
ncbi:undecaprenyl/decaprenyl-phosphate alpha-N-acetylglucosaminyl 1-phosphate transferase [Zoogloea sp.]|uniref:undecaprenyl/decaprenyl-phosphate alpha-N-acetylglucosaminyl 1-phosphate transferase n=1 Tax=Zoogloea sp. TaxID=49181 RepID=UPI0035B10A4E